MATEHRTIPADGIHIAHAFKTADLGTLTVVAGDIDKLALLTTTGMYYRLSSVTPVTWVQHGHTDAQIKAIVHDIPEVTGLQSALDSKVDDSQVLTNVPTNAIFTDTVYTHPTTDGSLHVPATGTTNNGKVLTAGATPGVATWETLPSGVTDHTLLTNIGTNTHAQIDTALTRLVSTSGTNTGDETVSTIKTKLGITTLSGSNTGDQDLSGYSPTTHNHTGVYEPVIAVKNTGFNLNTGTTTGTLALGDHVHTGVYEPADATILKTASIGVTVQGYDVDTAKLDVAQTFVPAQRGSISTITYAATITPDFAVANNFVCTLTGNVVVANPTNVVAGQYGKITLIQDATGGRTIGYGTYFKFAGGVAPTAITTANAKTSYYYEVASATEIVITAVSDWK